MEIFAVMKFLKKGGYVLVEANEHGVVFGDEDDTTIYEVFVEDDGSVVKWHKGKEQGCFWVRDGEWESYEDFLADHFVEGYCRGVFKRR